MPVRVCTNVCKCYLCMFVHPVSSTITESWSSDNLGHNLPLNRWRHRSQWPLRTIIICSSSYDNNDIINDNVTAISAVEWTINIIMTNNKQYSSSNCSSSSSSTSRSFILFVLVSYCNNIHALDQRQDRFTTAFRSFISGFCFVHIYVFQGMCVFCLSAYLSILVVVSSSTYSNWNCSLHLLLWVNIDCLVEWFAAIGCDTALSTQTVSRPKNHMTDADALPLLAVL